MALAPSDVRAWSALFDVASAAGQAVPTPPAEVSSDRDYRVMVAETAMRHGDWDRALELTSELLHENDRSPENLLVRAMALADRPLGPSDNEPWHDVDRLTTEAIDHVDEDDPLRVQALTLRSAVRLRMGRTGEANADIDDARRIAHDNPEVLRHSVEARLAAGDQDGALQILLSSVADDQPLLLALRGGLRVEMGDATDGIRDLKAAAVLIPNASEPDSIRLMVADAATSAGDYELASRALESLTDDGKKSWRGPFFSGRLAFARGDIDEGVRVFRQAVDGAGKIAPSLLVELAERLFRAGRAEEAVRVFDEVGRSNLSPQGRVIFVAALMDVGDYVRSQDIVDEVAAQGPMPQWALAVAADIAFRREEPEAAIRSLTELIERGPTSVRVKVALTKALLDLDRLAEASAYLDGLVQNQDLSAIEQMQIAELLRAVGRPAEAVGVAFRSFRAASTDPDIQRAFASVLFMGGATIPPAKEVGPDTYVRLRRADGTTREYVVYSSGPIDPNRNEVSVEEAQSVGLMGLHDKDEFALQPGARNPERWTVESILPAAVHAAQDIVMHFGERFLLQPFFVEPIPVGENVDNPIGLAKLIELLGEQNQFQQSIVDLYREQTLPLGMVCERLGCMIVELMAAASNEPDKSGPLLVEWADAAGQQASLAAAVSVSRTVMTRSALETAHGLNLLDVISSSMSVVVPRSLLDEMRAELKEDQKRAREGYSKMGAGGAVGISITDIPAGHEGLTRRIDGVTEQLQWAQRQQVEPRPLDQMRPIGSPEEEVRGHLGRSSYDALILADRLGGALYADDLGLRKVSLAGATRASFSSVSLLLGMAERGLISGAERDDKMLGLVMGHYSFVTPYPELLDLAVRREPVSGRPALATTFALLGGPSITANEAARVAVSVIRLAALRPVKTVSLETLTEMALRAMAVKWQMPLCLRLLSEEAGQQLRLMPQYEQVVRQTCAKFRSH